MVNFIIGLVLGGIVGLTITALLVAGKSDEGETNGKGN